MVRICRVVCGLLATGAVPAAFGVQQKLLRGDAAAQAAATEKANGDFLKAQGFNNWTNFDDFKLADLEGYYIDYKHHTERFDDAGLATTKEKAQQVPEALQARRHLHYYK